MAPVWLPCCVRTWWTQAWMTSLCISFITKKKEKKMFCILWTLDFSEWNVGYLHRQLLIYGIRHILQVCIWWVCCWAYGKGYVTGWAIAFSIVLRLIWLLLLSWSGSEREQSGQGKCCDSNVTVSLRVQLQDVHQQAFNFGLGQDELRARATDSGCYRRGGQWAFTHHHFWNVQN